MRVGQSVALNGRRVLQQVLLLRRAALRLTALRVAAARSLCGCSGLPTVPHSDRLHFSKQFAVLLKNMRPTLLMSSIPVLHSAHEILSYTVWDAH